MFEDLLLHDAENKGNVVPLKDDSPAAMHWLLNHIYSDKREIESIDLALQVLGYMCFLVFLFLFLFFLNPRCS